jgi:hypothetical protein
VTAPLTMAAATAHDVARIEPPGGASQHHTHKARRVHGPIGDQAR